jgi:hypothetical protein
MGLFDKIVNVALAPSVAIGNLITKGISAVTGKTYGTTTTQQLASTTAGKVLGGAIAGTAAALGVAVAAPYVAAKGGIVAVASQAAKPIAAKIIAKPIQSLGIAAVIAGGGLGLVAPTFKAIKGATEIAVPVILGEKPLLPENISDVAKTIGIALGVGGIGTVAGIIATKVMDKKDEVTIPSSVVGTGGFLGSSDVMESAGAYPAQTVELGAKARSKRKKTAQGAQGQKITQRVDVRVGVNAANRKYLNIVSHSR